MQKAATAQQIDLALERFNNERYEESNQLLLGVISQVSKTSFLCFCIGRNYFYLGRVDEAENWFRASLEIKPPFRWSFYELARLLQAKGDVGNAAAQMANFCATYSQDSAQAAFNSVHLKTMLDLAHQAFQDHREAALNLYSALTAFGLRDYLAELRVLERQIDLGQLAAAAISLAKLEGMQPLDAWGLFAKARLKQKQGLVREALAVALSAADLVPHDDTVKVYTAHTLLTIRQFDAAKTFFDEHLVRLGSDTALAFHVQEIRFRMAVLTADHTSLLSQIRSDGVLNRLPNWLIVEALFTFALPGEQITQSDIEVAEEIAAFLRNHKPYSLGAILALYQFYSRRRLWDAITLLEQEIAATEHRENAEVLMRRFETLCARSQLSSAKDFFIEHYAGRELSQWESCVVLRFLAESKMWDDASQLLRSFTKRRFYFPDGDFFLLKICRRTAMHQEMLSIIDSIPTSEQPSEFVSLRRAIADDFALRTPETDGETPVISSYNKFLIKRRKPTGKARIVGFLCSDKSYFLSVLTFLASHATNIFCDTDVQWYVFLDNDVPRGWHRLLEVFAKQIGLDVHVKLEDEIIAGKPLHTDTYGIFTGGNTLSRAAFFRIYAARYLLSLELFERAFYVDSDIVVLRDLATFYEQPFGGCALLARAEESSPEVIDVSRRHGLAEDAYFNSGVLAFDFSHSEIKARLETAILVSENDPDRLVFHDQCALNIAFSGAVRYLPPEHNYFIRPHRPNNGDYSRAVLIHFLDKPKPWDVSYHRDYRLIWQRYLDVVRVLLSTEDFNAVVAGANS